LTQPRESLPPIWLISVRFAIVTLLKVVLAKVAIKRLRLTLLTLLLCSLPTPLPTLVSSCEGPRDPSTADTFTPDQLPLLDPSAPTSSSLLMLVSCRYGPLPWLISTLPETQQELTKSKHELSTLGKELVSLAFSAELLVMVFAPSPTRKHPSVL